MTQPKPKKNKGKYIADLVIKDIKARKKKGLVTYGVCLQANNGRNALVDFYEEMIDAVQYLKQHIEEYNVRLKKVQSLKNIVKNKKALKILEKF